jgi:hypothetical protein
MPGRINRLNMTSARLLVLSAHQYGAMVLMTVKYSASGSTWPDPPTVMRPEIAFAQELVND